MKKILLITTLFFYSFINHASVILVINTNDTGTGSLREATINAINGDTIQFLPSLISGGSDTILLTTGEISFSNKDLTIIGLLTASDTLFISGNNTSRVFNIGGGNVVLDHVTIINGSVPSGVGAGVHYASSGCSVFTLKNSSVFNNSSISGGGVGLFIGFNHTCTFKITNSSIYNNSATTGNGGGVYLYGNSNTQAYLNVTNSIFDQNSAGRSGGGIYLASYSSDSYNQLTIYNSTISNNSANGASTGYGGGIQIGPNTTNAFIKNTTINNNTSALGGGGISSSAGITNILNSTICYNTVLSSIPSIRGGGIYTFGNSLIIKNTTISRNIKGGIAYFGTLEIGSSIVALNTISASITGGITTNNGFNIFSDNPAGSSASDQTNVSAIALNLDTLKNNGNTTNTLIPLSPSVAINMGDSIDFSSSQNQTIIGKRDAGAAENCVASSNLQIISADSSYIWLSGDGNTYSNDTIAVYTYPTNNYLGCDSMLILILTINTPALVGPTPTCIDTTVYLDSSGNVIIDSSYVISGSICDLRSVIISADSFSCNDTGLNIVNVLINGSISCTANVTVLDTIDPTPMCRNITAYIDATGNVMLDSNAIDNGSNDNCSISRMSISPSSFTCADTGINSVTLTVFDVNGNIGSCSANVTIMDTISPTAICQNINAYLDATGNVMLDSNAIDNGSNDNCGITRMALSPNTFNCSNAGFNNVTLTVYDVNGNSSSCQSTVNVIDNISPTITCPQDLVDTATNTCEYTILDYISQVTTNDNCNSSNVYYTQSPSPGAIININSDGTPTNITVTITATDSGLNTNSCSFNITITCFSEIMIPQFISPNGDNYNDMWHIENLAFFPENEVRIFNRFGNLVYSQESYNNKWQGESNSPSFMLKGNNKLPAGTYYYILKTNHLKEKLYQGYIFIRY